MGRPAVGVDGGVSVGSRVDLAVVGECLQGSVAATTEEVGGFGGGEPGGPPEGEVFECGFGVFLAVEDGVAVIDGGPPEAVVGTAAADDVFAGDVFAVVVQRGVEGVVGGDLVDVPRRDIGAGAEVGLGGDFIVGSEELPNSSLMRCGCVLACVGSGVGHTLDPTSYLVNVTI